MVKLFVLYDGRAKSGDTDKASVYVTASSEKEAIKDGQDQSWQDGIWYEYDADGGVLTGGVPRWDLPPARKVDRWAECGSNKCKNEAKYIVCWPGQTIRQCGECLKGSENIARAMGFELSSFEIKEVIDG